MVVTVVLRLLSGPLESGELVGHAELVASGLTEPVRSAQEVVAFARKVAAGQPEFAIGAAEGPDLAADEGLA